jgi:hypothetical protein
MLLVEKVQELILVLLLDDLVKVPESQGPCACHFRRSRLTAMAKLESASGVVKIVLRVCIVAQQCDCGHEDDSCTGRVLCWPGEDRHDEGLSWAAGGSGL